MENINNEIDQTPIAPSPSGGFGGPGSSTHDPNKPYAPNEE